MTRDIEIIDKVNDDVQVVPYSDDFIVVHPVSGDSRRVGDYPVEGHRVVGIILEKDGSTLFCYKKNRVNEQNGQEK